MPARKKTAETETTETTSVEITPITMTDFMDRPDRGEWLTVKRVAARLGLDADKHQIVRNAVKKRPEFQAEGAKLLVEIEGYDMPPLTYVHVNAVDAYNAARSAEKTSGNGRGTRNGLKRYVIRFKPADHDAVVEALAPLGITIEAASRRKPKASNDVDAAVSSDQAPVDMFSGDLVEV